MTTVEEVEEEFITFVAETEDRPIEDVRKEMQELKSMFTNKDVWLSTLILLRDNYVFGSLLETLCDEVEGLDKSLAKVITGMGQLLTKEGDPTDKSKKIKTSYSVHV